MDTNTANTASPAAETPIQRVEAALAEFSAGAPCVLKENFDGTFTAKNEFGVEYKFEGSLHANLKGTPS